MREAQARSAALRITRPILLALAAATLFAALTACGGPSQPSDPLVGYWAGGGTDGMRLVHIVKDGDSYNVFANPDYPTPDPVKDGDKLVIDTHVVTMTLTPAGTDSLTLSLTGDVLDKPETYDLKRVTEEGYADAATAMGLTAIRRGLAMWKAGGADEYPPAKEVTPTGMLGQMIDWPTNLFTGQPMQPGTAKGDYTYRRLNDGKGYSLTGHLSDGTTVGK